MRLKRHLDTFRKSQKVSAFTFEPFEVKTHVKLCWLLVIIGLTIEKSKRVCWRALTTGKYPEQIYEYITVNCFYFR